MDEYRERIKAFTIKAVREAKIHTAWLRPDKEYEEAFIKFVEGILRDSPDNLFLKEFLPFQGKIAWYGILNSLAQLAIKAAAPGVPDFYQGAELWDLSLVDPDNRRPVDFARRAEMLKIIRTRMAKDRSVLIDDLLASPEDGRIKLFTTHAALAARKSRKELFRDGAYLPVEIKGRLRRNLIAFARTLDKEAAIVIAPRFMTAVIPERSWPVGEVWAGTYLDLPDGLQRVRFRDAFTGKAISFSGPVEAAAALAQFPVAFLVTD